MIDKRVTWLLALSLPLGAFAQQQISPLPYQQTGDAHAAAVGPQQTGCLTETGSRIKPAGGGCMSQPGRSYDREDIDRTGSTTLGDAIGRLDPSVRVSPH